MNNKTLFGYRIVYPGELGRFKADFVQISFYPWLGDGMQVMEASVRACRERGWHYVIHPVSNGLIKDGPGALEPFKKMAALCDWALILHDERDPDGARVQGRHGDLLRERVRQLQEFTKVSFENSLNTADAPWFWRSYADSVTLDIGHMEGAGLDSVEYVRGLGDDILKKVDFVHMHRNWQFRSGLTDHWPLTPGCREVRALRELLKKKQSLGIILELNEVEETGESLEILREAAGSVLK